MHVAITGASSGIGASLARAFARTGAKLTLVARRRELLEKLAVECGGDPFIVAQDLADTAHATDWLAPAEAKHGPIDVLINNAGMENIGRVVTSDVAEGLKLLQLNLATPLVLTHAILPAMIARKTGTIVQVTSVAAISAAVGQSWYGASKAGLAMFSETLRPELVGTGVHVLVVYPGPVKTPMGDAAFVKYGGRDGAAGKAPEGDPDTLADRVVRAVQKKSDRVIYPSFYWTSWVFPRFSRWVAHTFTPMPK